MRILFTLMCVLALGAIGCSETAGTGGSGGSSGAGGDGGIGGDGGTGGMPECESAEDCDDRNECTANACADGMCEFMSVENGTACDEANECTVGTCAVGTCDATPVADDTACGDDAGTCQQGSCRVTCDEQGIRDAIAAGGGPYTFDCDGPTTVGTGSSFVIEIDNDVILDGEGVLTVEQQEPPNNTPFAPVFIVTDGVTAELRGLSVTGGGFTYGGGGIENRGHLTLTNCAVFGNDGGTGSIGNAGTLLVVNSTVSGNQSENAEIYNFGELTLISSTIFGDGDAVRNEVGASMSEPTATLTNSIVVGGCSGVGVSSNDHNIESPGDSCGFTEEGDHANVDAEDLKLEPLADNGGPKTHALLPGSVAIDQIPAVDCVDADGEPLTTDQRGEPRPGGTMCDVGAFEVQP